MTKIYALKTKTPVGDFWMIIEANDIQTVRLSGFGSLTALAKRLPEDLTKTPVTIIANHPYEQFVTSYFKGDSTALDNIPHRQHGSVFAEKIWRSIEKIAYGTTVSYRQLATMADSPGATRAAGTACGLNKLVLLVPCHRIVRSNGELGKYLYGPEIKKHLLNIEGASLTGW